MNDLDMECLRSTLLHAYRNYQELQDLHKKETGVRWVPPVLDDNYCCPIHGQQDGPDCVEC